MSRPQNRHSVATWPASLRVRLMLLVAISIAAVIGIATYLQLTIFERGVEGDLRNTAVATAMAVADDIELRPIPLDLAHVNITLQEFIDADPVLRTITIVALTDGRPVVVTSTAAEVRQDTLGLARQAIELQEPAWSNVTPLLPKVAAPLMRDGQQWGAVVVTLSLASIQQLRDRGRIIAATFALFAIVVSTILVNLLVRRYIHRPIGGIRDTMSRVTAGALGDRAPVLRRDEIGAIADGLNQMLEQLEHFNVDLQARVREATEELRLRNRDLVDSYDRMLSLREALARTEQMAAVGQMAANVAHQIGTPLNLISGYVQLAREDAQVNPHISARLQIVEEQIAKVTAIVRSLLDRGRHPSIRELVDPVQLVEHVCELARPKLQGAGVTLDLKSAATLPLIRANAVQLELAFLNVISNALDAMPGGGTLLITARSKEGGVAIEFADTGTGIPAEILPRVFEPWITTKPEGRGTGLGLSITRDVVVGHGGTIAAHNGPSGGAVFSIELPAEPAPLAVAGDRSDRHRAV